MQQENIKPNLLNVKSQVQHQISKIKPKSNTKHQVQHSKLKCDVQTSDMGNFK